MPLREDNALYIAGLYFDYAEYNPAYDYESYMTGMDELSKFEVQFKCVEDPTTWTPAPSTAESETMNTFFVNGLDQEYLINFNNFGIWGILNVHIPNLKRFDLKKCD